MHCVRTYVDERRFANVCILTTTYKYIRTYVHHWFTTYTLHIVKQLINQTLVILRYRSFHSIIFGWKICVHVRMLRNILILVNVTTKIQ